MATKMGMTRQSPPKPLKRSIPLRARKGLNKMSDKQQKRNAELAKIKPPSNGLCEECKQKPDWRGLAKHHIVKRSHNGSDDRTNLKWLCGVCHSKAHYIKEV